MTTTAPPPVQTAVEKRNAELSKSAWGLLNGMKSSIAQVLPKHLTAERMAMIAFTAMRRNPKLLECSRESIIASILTAAMLGLEPSGPLGHGALIPYGRECQFQPMYQGLLDLARRSGFIRDVQLRPVYKGDTYSYRFGLDPDITHVPLEGEGADDPNRDATHVYCVIRLVNGGVQWDQMSYAQGLAHGMRYSPSFNTREFPNKFKPGSVWADNPLAMILKTILKKVLKLCPKSPELAAAMLMDDFHEAGKTTHMEKMADGVFDVDIAEPEMAPVTPPNKGTLDVTQFRPGKEENRGHDQENLGAIADRPGSENTAPDTQANGDPVVMCDPDDMMDIETMAADAKIPLKEVHAHITGTMGYPEPGMLARKRKPEVLAWIKAHSRGKA